MVTMNARLMEAELRHEMDLPESTWAPAHADGPKPSNARQVLIVEDHPDARDTLRELLELWGYCVDTAGDGPHGLEIALLDPPRVALIDIGLPGFDGYELARRIRSGLGAGCPRLIAMTGYCQPEYRQLSMDAGFDHYMVKPVDLKQLGELLAQMTAV
jgi:two-component system, sensor histidine kinase